MRHGLLLGAIVTAVASAPLWLWGREFLSEGSTPLFLPALLLLMAPGAVMGFVAMRRYPGKRDVWRFNAGLLLGASVAGGWLFLPLANEDFAGQRTLLALVGGIYLCGFWMWIGGFLGAAYAGIGNANEPSSRV